MKRPPTKAQIRAELEKQIQHYLRDGGEVKNIPKGISGQHDNRNLFAQLGENPPRQDRTPLDEVVKTLEARKKHPNAPGNRSKKPRKILITDDFGEPLRWVWTDE